MRIGVIGAGKMGTNLALNLRDNGHTVHIYNRSKERLEADELREFHRFSDLELFLASMEGPRIIWIVIPGGALTSLIETMLPLLKKGDILVDYSNSHYRVTKERAARLKEKGIGFIDVGFCGALNGAREGACFAVGGEESDVKQVERAFVSIASEGGYAHIGKSGMGHYIKMVHNGIEYAMMQAIGEGFSLLEASEEPIDLNVLSGVWNSGAMISGTLMGLTHEILENGELEEVEGIVDTSGEASYALLESIEKHISIPAISASLYTRFKSQDEERTTEKLVSVLRGKFGGHKIYLRGKK
ncbi:NADP-dependent phosphogluconate dehydrogenase [Guggenheimella bovis]